MRRVDSAIAVIGAALLLAPAAGAQVPARQKNNGFLNGLVNPYSWEQVTPPSFANSSRLDALLKAGNIYLSLQDAIALALENNLDLAIARYNLDIADTDILLTRNGAAPRGAPSGLAFAELAGYAGRARR